MHLHDCEECTHPLRKDDAKHEEREEPRGAQPAVEDEGRDTVQPPLILALPLGVVDHERLEGASGGLGVG